MFKRTLFAWMLALALLTVAVPVLGAQGGGGGIHFGPYTLTTGDRVTGDLVVFGPATLERDATFNGNLTAFGAALLGERATVRGDLNVFGAADIAGTVRGNVFAAGDLRLRATARVEGNVAVAGALRRDEGAVIEGEIQRVEGNRGFRWTFPFEFRPIFPENEFQPPLAPVRPFHSLLLDALWRLLRGFLTILVLGLFALLVMSLWPRHVERVAETIINVPLPSFGVGLLSFIGAAVLLVILTVTICLSPLAFIGGIIVGLGMILGWVALGWVLGERILRGLFRLEKVTPAMEAVVGTVLLTTLAVLVQLAWNCLAAIMVWPLLALVTGAVVLTQFGTVPYAATGNVRPPVVPPPVPPRRPVPPVSPAAPPPPAAADLPSPFEEDAA